MRVNCVIALIFLSAASCWAQTKAKQSLTQPQQSIGTLPQGQSPQQTNEQLAAVLRELTNQTHQVVPNPGQYDPAYLTAVNGLHGYQIDDLLKRVGSLESSRTYFVGASIGIGFLVGLLWWLRQSIIQKLVGEAMPVPKTSKFLD